MRRTVIPPVEERRGARLGSPARRGSRRGDGADRTVELLTTDFFEQIGQFSTMRLWRQKVGTAPVYGRKGAPRGAPLHTDVSAPRPAQGLHFADWRFWTTV